MRERKSNFELLRIFAMFMIVGSHLACHGVQHQLERGYAYQIWDSGSAFNKIFVSFLVPGGGIGVAIFFMLTGYFQINAKKCSLHRVILETVFYGWMIAGVYVIAKLSGILNGIKVKFDNLLEAVLNPVSSGTWWFVTVYVFVVLSSQTVNSLLQRFNKVVFIRFILISWMFWYTVAYFIYIPFADIYRGFFFYILGAFCRLHMAPVKGRGQRLFCALMFCGSWILGAFLFYETAKFSLHESSVAVKFILVFSRTLYFSLVIPICSITVFKIFEAVEIGKNHVINIIASTTFCVYLLSDSQITRNILWHRILKVDVFWYTKQMFPLFTIGIIVVVFSVSALIDLIRIRYIEPKYLNLAERCWKLIDFK